MFGGGFNFDGENNIRYVSTCTSYTFIKNVEVEYSKLVLHPGLRF